MSLAAMHPGRCIRCQGRIEPGDEIDYFPGILGGAAEVRHVGCPDPKPGPTAPTMPPTLTVDEATCPCGASFARRKDQGGIPDGAPSPCCGEPLQVERESVYAAGAA